MEFQVLIASSIVAVPAIGSDPWSSWFGDDSNEPWLISDLSRQIPNARVLLYDHGKPSSRDDLDSLAHNLLNQLHQQRLSAVGYIVRKE
jgi:hypothetical protein